ncbi:MAG TPA: TerB family tellurite resistance protein, partial [Vicinamibacteria bacterium]|nr:TerB family tellurite resistance protein [Vicinamibacteria bacterium]
RDLLQIIAEFFEQRRGTGPALRPDRYLQLSAAALMVSVLRADRESRTDEHRVLERAIGRVLGVGAEVAARVIRFAEEKLTDQVPFRNFVRLLDQGCTAEEKRHVLESLWRIAYADAELEAHEEYLIRKVCEHLHLTKADLVEAKIRARERFLAEDL